MNAHSRDFRPEAPNNIEAEQALLGAMLMNNDAFYRVSDFLQQSTSTNRFTARFSRSHRNVSGQWRRSDPDQVLLPASDMVGKMTVAQYLARLAAEAITIVNAADYGKAVYDLAQRRKMIVIGEELVSVAYDAPADTPAIQIRPRCRGSDHRGVR